MPTPKPPTFPLRNTPTPTPAPVTPSPTPEITPEPTRVPNPAFYTVQEGDSLTSVAEQFGVPLFALLVVNDLEEGDFIIPGQVLIIPAIDVGDDDD